VTPGHPITLCGPFFARKKESCRDAIFIHEFFHTTGC